MGGIRVKKTRNIADWFDINNIDHLKAYDVLLVTGVWEAGFIPKDLEFPPGWQILIMSKLADAYIKEKIGEKDTLEKI